MVLVETFKFATLAKGVTILPILDADVTLRVVRVPTDVILGCAGVIRVPVSAVRFETPVTFSDVRIPVLVIFGWAAVMSEPVRAVRLERPDTLREVRIPVLVILGCAEVAKDPVIAEPDMRLEPSMAPL